MKLVALLHGYGASGADLRSLSKPWETPDHMFIAPDAPDFCAGMGPGYEWFSLDGWIPGTSFDPFKRRVDYAAVMLKKRLEQELSQRGLEWKDLVIMGFSQGAIMAFAVGLNAPEPCAGIMAYSGKYLVPDAPKSKPPVLVVHGGVDVVVSPEAYHDTIKMLEARGIEHHAHFLPTCGHWIDMDGLNAGKAFLNSLP